MNTDQLEGKWKTLKGQVQQKWGKLTHDDLDRVNGKLTELEGRIQERYGIEKAEAKKQIEEFCKSCNC
ncbi:MAG: CsbD family protein [Phycisphaerales bacterium]|nr:CsbD family protein [Phycisphaerales bacterium]MCB9863143.1 CsbD family protein [Phycisphaerales bacterium]